MIIYQAWHDGITGLRYLSIVGGFLLLLVENKPEAKTFFGDVPSFGDNKPRKLMHLAGRNLVILMYLTLLRFDSTTAHLMLNIAGTLLIVLVVVGYRTKASALTLSVMLAVLNLTGNAYWNVDYTYMSDQYYFKRYDFFQTISVIGGLLFVVILGPGEVSVDEHKKRW